MLRDHHPTRSVLAAVALVPLLVSACGSGDGSSTGLAPEPPATFEEKLLRHLGDGLGDAELAAELLRRLGEPTVDALEEAVGGDVTHQLLALDPPRVPADEVDSLLVFAFGNRIGADGTLSAGPTNEMLAAAVAAFLEVRAVPVYAQWEVGDLLLEQGWPGVQSIGVTVDENGQVVYLSTAGVARQAIELAGGDAAALGAVGVVAFADHAVRSVLTARAAGIDGAVPRGVDLPSMYDAESGQPWTRDRATYLAIDLAARLGFAR